MKIFISGICGTGMGPLALIAHSAGIEVVGSDLAEGAVFSELTTAGIPVHIGSQDGNFLRTHLSTVDWFIYTSALAPNHPELLLARQASLKISKRDEFINFLIQKFQLKLIAIAGTHGKTTTTSMIIFTAVKFNLPVSYLVGTTLPQLPSGIYHSGDRYLVYEADEYDRNFLHFHPWLAVIPTISYDHSNIYPTLQSYQSAFVKFKQQSQQVLENPTVDSRLTLVGPARRLNATLAKQAILKIEPTLSELDVINVLNQFPGANRRFERLADGIYSDYAHHPKEISATLEMAEEEAKKYHKKGIIVIYQPHQNTRQHQIFTQYHDIFNKVTKLFWLPTFLTREDPSLSLLSPEDFIHTLDHPSLATPANLNQTLADQLKAYQSAGYLIILMTAGPADSWFRRLFARNT